MAPLTLVSSRSKKQVCLFPPSSPISGKKKNVTTIGISSVRQDGDCCGEMGPLKQAQPGIRDWQNTPTHTWTQMPTHTPH